MFVRNSIILFDTFIAHGYRNHNPFVAPGLQGVKTFFANWLITFPDTVVTVEDAFVAGDKAVGRYTYRATPMRFNSHLARFHQQWQKWA